MELLKMHVSALEYCDQEEALLKEGIGGISPEVKGVRQQKPDIIMKIGGQFITLKKDRDDIFNKEISFYSSICPVFKQLCNINKINTVFTKSPN
jgi:hypothetical protein